MVIFTMHLVATGFASDRSAAPGPPLATVGSWLHGLSDFVIGGALLVIAAVMFTVVQRQQRGAMRRAMLWVAGFLTICGGVHVLDSGQTGWLAGLARFAAVVIAGWAVWLLAPWIPRKLDSFQPRSSDEAVAERTRELQELTDKLQSEVKARRRVEQSLRESEERLRMVVAAGRMGTWEWDLKTGATRLDRKERDLFGLPDSGGTVHVDDVFSRMHPEDREGVRAATQKSIDTRAAYDHEFRVVLDDGTTRWLAGRGDVVRSSSGTPLRMIGVNFDVTERRTSDQHYRLIDRALHSATNGIAIADAQAPDCPIIYVNEGFESLTGFSRGDVIGRNCRFLQGPDTDPSAVQQIRDGLACGEGCHVTILNYRKDGSPFWNELRITPVTDDADQLTHFVGVQADITQRKQFEESLQRAEALAQAASQAKSEFLANMSHEIRTPLTAVLGCADTLFPHLSNEEHREMVQMIRRQGRLLLGILNDVLDLSKIEAGRLEIDREACSIVAIIEDVRSLLQPQASEKGLELRTEYASMMPVVVETDPLRIRQVLVNLVGNAIKFTNQGHVSIVAYCDVDIDPPQLVINVRDTGIGIPPNRLDAIFEAFTQENSLLTRKVGGTGLGLTISQRLLGMLGGAIRAASELNQGTTFTVTLPIQPDETTALQSGSELTRASIEQQRSRDSLDIVLTARVLLAEDTHGLQFMIRRMLENAGAAVAVVENGERAVEAVLDAQNRGQPYDVVLMDMQMPVLDGFDATAQLREAGCHVPIIALTAAAMQGDREKCLAAGCDDYLSKPIDRHTLLDVIAQRYNRTGNSN